MSAIGSIVCAFLSNCLESREKRKPSTFLESSIVAFPASCCDKLTPSTHTQNTLSTHTMAQSFVVAANPSLIPPSFHRSATLPRRSSLRVSALKWEPSKVALSLPLSLPPSLLLILYQLFLISLPSILSRRFNGIGIVLHFYLERIFVRL